jgi:predicted ATPase/DNA-binding SARP family transcriptional activator/DNA-binding CsgD family transcriptional regulator
MMGSQRPITGLQHAPRQTGLGAVRIWLLDDFRVSVGSSASIGEDEWRLRKAASLVKLLALAPAHRLHREQAMDLLWPELDSKAALNNLHHALHIARRTLQPSAGSASGCLRLRGENLTLSPEGPVWVDVEAFEEAVRAARHALEPAAYRAAIDLYAGDLLPQDRYEVWAEERRAQLRGLYLSLLLELGALYEERKEYGEAIEALGRVVAEEPTHEGAHVGLIRLYALLGRRGEALGQYERLRDVLSREFGAEPEAAAVRLHQEIWAGTFPPAHSPLAAGSPSEELRSGGRHNLPLARTSFIGRERETLEVKRLLAMTRLLTLTGVGGSGKTRLALKVASDLAAANPDGAWLVDLASLSDPALVPQAVGSALRVREQPNRPLVETLEDALRAKKMLLVVDNCEHLIEAVVRLIDALLDSCPGLRVLATSRETLNAAGEVAWVVPSLTVPYSWQEVSTAEELEGYESVRLFVDRAVQRDPSFVLSAANGPAVAQICRRLEGIPLAIELAAARIGVLSAERIAERLDDSLRLLTAGGRTALPRQRTIRATLEWSYELLGEPEQRLFGRLSAFAGGSTLEAAEAVGAGDGIEQHDVLDLLSKLVDKSLVMVEVSPGEEGTSRYRMLETLRQYGQERLEESGEARRVRERHARYYLALAEGADAQEAERGLNAARPVAWLKRMESEHANLRAALDWSLDEPDGSDSAGLGSRLAVALWWFWHTRDYLTEGRRYLERAGSGTSNPTTTRLRARALDGAAWLALYQGDQVASKALIEEALALYRELQDEEGIASGLTDLGLVAVLGQWDDISLPAVLEKLAELKPGIKNRNTLAYLLMLEGMIAMSRGDPEHSATLHERSLQLFREIQNTQGMITCLGHLGLLALILGDYEGAPALLRESLRLAWELDYKQSIQHCLYTLACVAACSEQPVRAAGLWGVVEGMEEVYGAHLTPIILSLTIYERHLSLARSQLGVEGFAVALAGGKTMSLGQAIEYALSDEEGREPPTLVTEQQPPAEEPTEKLTRREREVALLVARGLTNRQIASELSVSRSTANNHVARILRKLGLHSRAQIAAWVTERRPPSS